MTEQPLTPIDPGTLHPAIRDALQRRAPLLWAYDNDAAMREQVRQLNVVLLALDRAMVNKRTPDYDRDVVPGLMLADPTVLPTDEVLVQRRYEHERRVRELTMRLPVPVVVSVAPCPECVQGKHQNCTGVAYDGDHAVRCPCKHDQPPGTGFLVIPPGVRGESADGPTR